MKCRVQIVEECPNCKSKRIRELPWHYPGALCWTCFDLVTDAIGRPVKLENDCDWIVAEVTLEDGRKEQLPLNKERFDWLTEVAEVFIGDTPYICRVGKFESIWVQSVAALKFEEQARKEYERAGVLSADRQFAIGAEHGFPVWLFTWATDLSLIEAVMSLAVPLRDPDSQLFVEQSESRRPATRTIDEPEDSENNPRLVSREIDGPVPDLPNDEMNIDHASVGSPFINKSGEIVGDIVYKKPAKDKDGNPVFVFVYRDLDGDLKKTVAKSGEVRKLKR